MNGDDPVVLVSKGGAQWQPCDLDGGFVVRPIPAATSGRSGRKK